jgi:RHS repeat-associated protein
MEVRVLEGQNLLGWLTNEVVARDEWGKPTEIHQTHLEGEDAITIQYNVADKPVLIYRKHQGMNGATEGITQTFQYDRQLRPVETTHQFDGGIVQGLDPMMLSQLRYNFKDQLMEKKIGKNLARNGSFLQSIDYLYNVRGWLTSINGFGMTATNRIIPIVKKDMDALEEMIDLYSSESSPRNDNDENADLFSQVLNYETAVTGLQAPAQRNGNVSSTIWQVAGREKQAYGFQYDDLNRLTEAYYADVQVAENNRSWNRPNVTFSRDNAYMEKVQYDVRGNITSLQRNGLKVNGFTGNAYLAGDFGRIDDLQYEYNDQNQVTRITDHAVNPNGLRGPKDLKGFVYNFDAANLNEHYRYDANGNMTYDAHKDIVTIEYNYLNLPSRILFTNDRSITFLYDATGKKLRKTVTGNGQTEQRDYLDGIEYKDGKPDQFLHSEGTVRADKDGQYHYYFVLRDHLGNTRVTFSDLNNDDKINEKEELIQINNYYAFGLNMEGNWNGKDGANKYQYNGKEWNDDFGLGWNDYGARFYDPAMARWQAVDPMADSRLSLSPYQYVQNNPINRNDPTGMLDEASLWGGTLGYESQQKYKRGAQGAFDDMVAQSEAESDERIAANATGRLVTGVDGKEHIITDADIDHDAIVELIYHAEEQKEPFKPTPDATYVFLTNSPHTYDTKKIDEAIDNYKYSGGGVLVIELSIGILWTETSGSHNDASWSAASKWINKHGDSEVKRLFSTFERRNNKRNSKGQYECPKSSLEEVKAVMKAKHYIEQKLKEHKITKYRWEINSNGYSVIRFPMQV